MPKIATESQKAPNLALLALPRISPLPQFPIISLFLANWEAR
jgi:hypothetical protein